MSLVIDSDADHETVITTKLLNLNPQDCSLVHMNGPMVGNCAIV